MSKQRISNDKRCGNCDLWEAHGGTMTKGLGHCLYDLSRKKLPFWVHQVEAETEDYEGEGCPHWHDKF